MPGTSLNEDQAMQIYMHKLASILSYELDPTRERPLRGQSTSLAIRYGVSPKAIRDIWNRRTWAHATIHLWSLEDPDIGEVHATGPESFQVSTFEFIGGLI